MSTTEIISLDHEKSIASQNSQPLSESVKQTLDNYFANLDGQNPVNLYILVLKQVEIPLLKVVMEYTKENQCRAAILLGISRGTLRKKLKIYSDASSQNSPLSESVKQSLDKYFVNLEGHNPVNVYKLVLEQVELPLLEVVMKYVNQNQCKAAILLGISRGTLRKKLKIYNLEK